MLTQREVLLIKISWSYLVALEQEIGILFYSTLFELEPRLRPMFGASIDAQAQKLMSTLTYVVSCVQNTENYERDLEELARKHDSYQTRPEHYELVGKALMITLREVLGDNWDDETELAWVKMYTFLSDKMIRAQQQFASSSTLIN
ncbi:hypothetical protein EP331_12055 [bacterium]|nr:MAG: hypothetical protein EP331_12055 [bacterium]